MVGKDEGKTEERQYGIWTLGGPIWNRLCILGGPIRNRLCRLGGPIRHTERNRMVGGLTQHAWHSKSQSVATFC